MHNPYAIFGKYHNIRKLFAENLANGQNIYVFQ